VAIPYPGIGGFPRVGLPRIGLTPAQRRAAVLAALVALGCTTLTGDQADVRTREDDPPRKPTVRVRHYSRFIQSIKSNMIVKVNSSILPPGVIWVEYPIITPYDERAIQQRTSSFFITGVRGFVEFNVDLNKWNMTQDPNIPWDPTSKIIVLPPPFNRIGFPLSLPEVAPAFFDATGGHL
jgi:hypothetical protein